MINNKTKGIEMKQQLTKKQERDQLIINLKEATSKVEKTKEEYRTLYNNYKDTQDILYIFPNKWTYNKFNFQSYYCYSDYNWAQKLYQQGQNDALINKNYILNFFNS